MAESHSENGYRDGDTLREMYHGEEMTADEIAGVFDVSQATISKWLHKNGIETRTSQESRDLRGTHNYNQPDEPYADADWLKEKYYDEKLTLVEIAEEAGLESEVTIMRWMDRHGLDRRDKSVALSMAHGYPAGVYLARNGYDYLRHSEKDHPYYLKHCRILAATWFDLDLFGDWVVHHKNGIKWDDREDNFEIFDSQREHAAHHNRERERDERGRYA